jgi:dTDP-4-dehydrorhamnose reductase
MRVVVLGGAGMLGHKVVELLACSHDTRWTLRGDVTDPALKPAPFLRGSNAIPHIDATRVDTIESLLRELRPNVVVNCLGVIRQRGEAAVEDTCMTLNAVLPHRVAEVIAPWGGRLIHISTDCVFSGDRGGYTEDDVPDASDLYGRTKALGEVRRENAITLRTSFIGRELKHHKSLLDWFLSQHESRVPGYRRVLWSGTTTLQLARIIDVLIREQPALAGVYHVSGGRLSKYELLLLIRDAFQLDVDVVPVDVPRRDLSLVAGRFERAVSYRFPSWPEMLQELAADPTAYPRLAASSRSEKVLERF